MPHDLLSEIGIAVIAAIVAGVLMHRLRQPIVLGYLLAGALIGPEIGFSWVANPMSITIISEIGLVLLLFIIGLEMDLKPLLASGRQVLAGGLGQFGICVLLGLGLFPLLGFTNFGEQSPGLYFSLACALSSTALVVKQLYDKFELDTIPGRITLGILIVQDIWAILILAFQPDFAHPRFSTVGMAIMKIAVLVSMGFILSRYGLRRVYLWVSKSPEMVVAVSIGWCALIAGMAGLLDLSREMGALIAGLSISTFPYSLHVKAKTLPLRDFFLTLFFISLGMKIVRPDLHLIGVSLVLVGFVILSRFASVYPLLAWSGSGRRTCFIASVNLGQISEFSLVIALLGVRLGHIENGVFSILTYGMAISSVVSSYLIKYNHGLYLAFDRLLTGFGLPGRVREDDSVEAERGHPIVVLGFHRVARGLLQSLVRKHGALLRKILVVDFNPEVLDELRREGVACQFGDVASPDTLEHASIRDARAILSTIPDVFLKGTDNLELVKTCRGLSPRALIIATAESDEAAERLLAAGADRVLLPYALAGDNLADFLTARTGVAETVIRRPV